MAQRAEKTTALTTVETDPRVRMKQVREDVAGYLKGNTYGLNHLGEMPTNMEDARRVIIALQDLLEKTNTKHRKATGHICELVHMMEHMNEYQNVQFQMISEQSGEVRGLHQLADQQERHLRSMNQRLRQVTRERDAVLTTMALQANMRAPEPVFMGVDMGSSNASSLDHIVAHLNRKDY